MNFAFSKEVLGIQEEVRDFIKKESTPEMLKETEENGDIYGGPEGRKIVQKMAAKGWLAPTWPKEYGGLDASETINYMIREEFQIIRHQWIRFMQLRQLRRSPEQVWR